MEIFKWIFLILDFCLIGVACCLFVTIIRDKIQQNQINKAFDKIDDLISQLNYGEINDQQYLYRLIQLRETFSHNEITGTRISTLIKRVRTWID